MTTLKKFIKQNLLSKISINAIMVFLIILGFVTNATAQNRTVTGKVVDSKTNLAIAFVNVQAKKIAKSVMTDGEGNFTIIVPSSIKELSFSSVGYDAQVINITNSNSLNVKLLVSTKNGDEVIVTGYNKVKRSEYAGAASTVTADKIRGVPFASFDNALQGRAPGLSVLSGSGQPGSGAAVILRGPTSISGGSTPLYILDGVPVEPGVFQSINPNTFESIDILKDAISTAQYGSRGAAGVIVATTKRGSGGKAKINFLYQVGRKFKPQFSYQMMNSRELLKAQEQVGLFVGSTTAPGWVNSPINPTFTSATPAIQTARLKTLDSLGNIANDWDANYFRDGMYNSYDLSLSAGTGKTRLYSSLGIYNEEGLIQRSDLKRYTLQNNLDYNDDKIFAQISSTIGYTKRNFQQSTTTNSVFNPFLSARISAPYLTPKLPDGSVNYQGTSLNAYGGYLIDAMEKDKNYNDQLKTTLSTTVNYKLLDYITLNAFGSADFRETQGTFYSNPLTITNTPIINTSVRTQGGSITESLGRNLQLSGRIGATYNKTFKENHDFSFSTFYETLRNFAKAVSQQGFNLDPRRPNTYAAVNAVNTTNAVNYYPATSGGRSQNGIESVAFLTKYSYKGKYVFNASYRQDGSSKLPLINRWQGFYAFGGVWNASKEKFLSKSKKIDLLRLKASYGSSANADNFPGGNYNYFDTYSTGLYAGGPVGLTQTLAVTNPGNTQANWEFTTTTNIGIEYGLFKNRVYGDFQLYNKITNGLYATQTLSATSGFGGFDINAGKMGNKGVEYNVNVDVLKKKDLLWTIGLTGSYNKNRILDLGQVPGYDFGTARITKGLPLGSHYEVAWSGVDAATGQPIYLDVNGNPTNVYNAINKVQNFGTYYAPYTGGITTAVSFKGFSLNTLFSWQKGSTRVNNLEFFVENPSFLQQGFNQAVSLDFWKKPGDQSRVQSPLYANQFSSKYIQDASFIRLRNLTLAYNLDDKVIKKLKINNARIFVQGQNLARWTKWKGYDPEDDNNISLSEYPNPRTINAGIDITF